MTNALPELSLTEWSVLGLIDEGETYGFSVAKLLAPDGDAGRVWTVPRPLVYRAIEALEASGLVVSAGTAPGEGGPRRTLVRASAQGHADVAAWLEEPIEHVREARSHLLMKILLLHRRGASPARLASRQRAKFASVDQGLQRQLDMATGFDAVLLRWRTYTVEMLDRFLEQLEP